MWVSTTNVSQSDSAWRSVMIEIKIKAKRAMDMQEFVPLLLSNSVAPGWQQDSAQEAYIFLRSVQAESKKINILYNE